MKNLKRLSILGLFFSIATLSVITITLIFTVFIPFYRDELRVDDFILACSHFPHIPYWGILCLAILTIILLALFIRIMSVSYNKIFKPLHSCEEFISQLADNNIPNSLDINDFSKTKVLNFARALNLIRDRILNQSTKLQIRQNREVKLRKSMDVASELKSIIISRLAPDIRLPLQTLQGINEIFRVKIALNQLTNDEILRHTTEIQHSITSISNLILRIIKFAESSNSDSDLSQINTVKTADIIDEAISTNKFLLNERDINVNTLFCPSMPENITIADELISQMLIILTRSIFRASEHGEDIFIYCDSTDEEVLLHVRDNKNANPRENLSDSFNNFDLEKASFKDFNSLSTTLLGLFFVKYELETIGGSLDVITSAQANNEAIIRFNRLDILSSNEAVAPQQSPNTALFSTSNYIQSSDINHDLYLDEIHKTPYNILLGEDNKRNALTTTSFLSIYNFNFFTLEKDVISQLSSSSFDAILLSNSMRHRHLLKIISLIRSNSSFSTIPIIVLVNKINKTKELELRSLDVSLIMLKPINFIHLAHRLRQLISYSRSH